MIPMLQSNANQGVQYSTGAESQNKAKLGRDDFLKIFLTQLQYQDPLNPMEGTEFTAQLAQFSSLEQLFNVNDNLTKIKSVQDSEARFQALGLIGKQIKARGDTITVQEGGGGTGAFSIDGRADCTVVIEDQAGNAIRKIPLGQLDAGRHDFTWDGRDEAGTEVPPGSYTFSVLALDETGQGIPADTFISGTVTKVNIEGEIPVLYVGDIAVDLSDISEVKVGQDEQGES